MACPFLLPDLPHERFLGLDLRTKILGDTIVHLSNASSSLCAKAVTAETISRVTIVLDVNEHENTLDECISSSTHSSIGLNYIAKSMYQDFKEISR